MQFDGPCLNLTMDSSQFLLPHMDLEILSADELVEGSSVLMRRNTFLLFYIFSLVCFVEQIGNASVFKQN